MNGQETDHDILIGMRSDIRVLKEQMISITTGRAVTDSGFDTRLRGIEISGSGAADDALQAVRSIDLRLSKIESSTEGNAVAIKALQEWWKEAVSGIKVLETKLSTLELCVSSQVSGNKAVKDWWQSRITQIGILFGVFLGILGAIKAYGGP
jgi:hypothetical protein